MLLRDSGHGAHFQYVERLARRVIDFLDVQPKDAATPGVTAFDAGSAT